MVSTKSVGGVLNKHGHLGKKGLGLVVDCILFSKYLLPLALLTVGGIYLLTC